jgi:membrane protease YdiL (CAAX protease family)
MPSNGSQLPAPDPKAPGEARAAIPADDRFAKALRGFGPLGLLAIGVITAGQIVAPLSAVLVLVWARRSRTPWREIGYVRPRTWIGASAGGIGFGIAFKFLMKMIVMPLLGADPINHAYHFLAGKQRRRRGIRPRTDYQSRLRGRDLLPRLLVRTTRQAVRTEPGRKGRDGAGTSAFFGSLHYFDQGLAGAEQAAITGLVFGTIFAVNGRIWMLMIAHAAFDLAALAMIYWNLESKVAHLVFK